MGLENNLDEHGEEIRKTSELVLVNQTIEMTISTRELIPDETLAALKHAAFMVGRLALSVVIISGLLSGSLAVTSLGTGAAFV